jgi:microcystin degradation protein MlrC
MAPRVLAARIFHESHAFSPFATKAADFTITRHAAALNEARGADTTLGGIVRELERSGAAIVLPVAAGGPPGGLVEHDFYRAISDELLAAVAAERPDAIAFELHGAMATPECRDVEGDLLSRLRRVVGPQVPIGVGLDLHAHMTPAMLTASDFCTACKENPHADVSACGEKVAQGVLAMLAGQFCPVQTLAKARMVLPGAQETASGPLHELHRQARQWQAADAAIWDVSLYNVYRALDDEDMGQAAVVVSNGASRSALDAAMGLVTGFWERRHEFADDLRSVEDTLALAESRRGVEKFAFADMGDRVLAGAPGDSTFILNALLSRGGPLRAAIPVTDPETVARAKSLGIGAHGRFELGGRLTPNFKPLPLDATVVAIKDGSFRMRGPYRGGESSSLGETTVLKAGECSIVVTSKPGFTHDPNAFEAMGVSLAANDIVVVKSGYHFTLNFAGLATPLLLRTPGIGYYTPGQFTWRHGRFWPEHEGVAPFTKPEIFASSLATVSEHAP